jgi:DNA-binding transcriptional LysR family regulator
MRPDLNALQALDAVARHGGFAAAAAILHKAQSAVSYQVTKLESQLGVRLLDRSGYRVKLTRAGEAILGEGRRLLATADHLAILAQHYAHGWEPRLTVILDGILPLEPTLRALRALAAEGVPTRIQVKVEFLGGVQFRFERDNADLMLVKDYTRRPNFAATPLPEVQCILCVAADHALAGRRRVTLAELHEHVELSVQDSSGRGDDQHMFGGERVFYFSGFIAKKQAMRMGLGFGWMPLFLIQKELRTGSLRELDYEGGSRYRFTPQLVSRLDAPLGPTGRRLMHLLGKVPPSSQSAKRQRPPRKI